MLFISGLFKVAAYLSVSIIEEKTSVCLHNLKYFDVSRDAVKSSSSFFTPKLDTIELCH